MVIASKAAAASAFVFPAPTQGHRRILQFSYFFGPELADRGNTFIVQRVSAFICPQNPLNVSHHASHIMLELANVYGNYRFAT